MCGVNTIPKFYNQGVNPYCIGYSIANVFLYKGLSEMSKLIVESSVTFISLTKAVMFIHGLGGWETRRKRHFQPLKDDNPGVIKVFQICTALRDRYDDKSYHDNSHCVGTVDNFIFDPNKHSPIPMNKKNLDYANRTTSTIPRPQHHGHNTTSPQVQHHDHSTTPPQAQDHEHITRTVPRAQHHVHSTSTEPGAQHTPP